MHNEAPYVVILRIIIFLMLLNTILGQAATDSEEVCQRYIVQEEGEWWSHEGQYELFSGTKTCQGKRKIFQLQTDPRSQKFYMYYINDLRAWLISDRLCDRKAVAKFHTNNRSPEGSWEISDRLTRDWLPEGLTVKCAAAAISIKHVYLWISLSVSFIWTLND